MPAWLPTYRVTALCLGWLTVDRSTQTYLEGFGDEEEVPVWAAAVEGGGHRVLIDTGISDPAWVSEHVSPCRQAPEETLPGALARLGWEPESVELVINTHLHYDHADGNAALPHARFYVSAREWEAAGDPIPIQRGIYSGRWLAGELTPFHYTLVAQDHLDVLPGLRLLQTPGHSAGLQSVLVNTAEGVLAVCGDVANRPENLALGVPPGILVSTEQALRSMDRLRAHADRVLTGHDPGLAPLQDRDFPPIPEAPIPREAAPTW
jgi:glyoxylase-like metal-dependent hydrolase (beta-lactamase superfamily II)